MKKPLRAIATIVLASTSLRAQDGAKPVVTVYPFGTTQSAAAVSTDLARPSASRALEGVLATKRFEAKDETANLEIQQQLDAAGSLSQFNSITQIKRDAQLQSKYVLVGYIETAEAALDKPAGNGNKSDPNYHATVAFTVKLFDVERGTAVASKRYEVHNGLGGADDCDEVQGKLAKIKCKAKNVGKAQLAWAGTKDKALANATNKVKDAVADFIAENVK